MRNADEAFTRFLDMVEGRVLDIGCGMGEHAEAMRKAGLRVETCDMKFPATFQCAFSRMLMETERYGGIWASHVLEHEQNVGLFLSKCWRGLQPGGVLAVTVPPMDYYDGRIMSGHLSFWNAGLLLYNIILAHFDCRDARVHTYRKNVSVIVRKVPLEMLRPLRSAKPDIESLAEFFPVPVRQGFSGDLRDVNW